MDSEGWNTDFHEGNGKIVDFLKGGNVSGDGKDPVDIGEWSIRIGIKQFIMKRSIRHYFSMRLHIAHLVGLGLGLLAIVSGGLLLAAILSGTEAQIGLEGKYYSNMNWEGEPAVTTVDQVVSSSTLRLRQKELSEALNRYSVDWTGYIHIDEAGTYTFTLGSDDGSWLSIDDLMVVDNGGMHGLEWKRGEQYLSKGLHQINIRYLQTGGAAALHVFWDYGEVKERPLDELLLLPPESGRFFLWLNAIVPYLLAALWTGLVGGTVFGIHALWEGNKQLALAVLVGGAVACFGLGQLGDFLIDYMLVTAHGTAFIPFTTYGYVVMYAIVPLAILMSASVVVLVSNKPSLGNERFLFSLRSFAELAPLLAAALAMNGYLFVWHHNFEADAYDYILPFHYFLQGRGYAFIEGAGVFPPGYAVASYLLFLITDNLQVATMLLNAVSYIFTIILAQYTGYLLAGRFAGFLAAFFLTFCPLVVKYSFLSYLSIFYMFLILLGFALFLNIILRPPSYLRSVLCGAALGYAAFTREEGLILAFSVCCFVIVYSLFLFFKKRLAKWSAFWKCLSYPACTLLMIGIFVFLQTYTMYTATGYWLLSGRLYRWYLKGESSVSPNRSDPIGENENGVIANTAITPQTADTRQDAASDTPGVDEREKAESLHSPSASTKTSVKLGLSLLRKLLSFDRPGLNTIIFLRGCLHVTLHACIPLLIMTSLWSYQKIGQLFSGRKRVVLRKNFHDIAWIVGGAFVFLTPGLVPVLVNNLRVRYVTHNVGLFLLIFIAVMLTRQISSLWRQKARYGVVLIGVVSLFTATGLLFTESPLFKNRTLALANYTIDRSVLMNLRDKGIPEDVVEKLKPFKGQTFPYFDLQFWNIVNQQLDEEEVQKYRKQIFTHASVIVPYTTLPQVLMESTYYQQRFRELIDWLGRHVRPNIENVKILTAFTPDRSVHILFYANGARKAIHEEHASFIPQGMPLEAVVEKMKREGIDYLVLANDFNLLVNLKELHPLWEDPRLAATLGLRLVYADPNVAQVYRLQ